jgi:hypothetical protein
MFLNWPHSQKFNFCGRLVATNHDHKLQIWLKIIDKLDFFHLKSLGNHDNKCSEIISGHDFTFSFNWPPVKSKSKQIWISLFKPIDLSKKIYQLCRVICQHGKYISWHSSILAGTAQYLPAWLIYKPTWQKIIVPAWLNICYLPFCRHS